METHLNLKSFGLRPILIFLMCLKEQKITKVSPRTSAANIRGKSLHPGLCVGSSSSVFAETYASSSRSSKSFLLPVYYNTKPSVRIHKNHEFLSNAYHIKMTIIYQEVVLEIQEQEQLSASLRNPRWGSWSTTPQPSEGQSVSSSDCQIKYSHLL